VAILLIVVLYALVGLVLRSLAALDMNDEVRIAFNVIGGIGALILPIVIYSIVDLRLTRRAVNSVGLNWCVENEAALVRVEMHKNHFTLVCRQAEKQERKKFRIRFFFSTWHVKEVQWL
jgi:hypothetical protein